MMEMQLGERLAVMMMRSITLTTYLSFWIRLFSTHANPLSFVDSSVLYSVLSLCFSARHVLSNLRFCCFLRRVLSVLIFLCFSCYVLYLWLFIVSQVLCSISDLLCLFEHLSHPSIFLYPLLISSHLFIPIGSHWPPFRPRPQFTIDNADFVSPTR